MKISVVNLWVLFGVVIVLLVSGCISETPGKWQEWAENNVTTKETPENKVLNPEKQVQIGNQNPTCDSNSECSIEPSGEINETGILENVNLSSDDWCAGEIDVTKADCPCQRKIWRRGLTEFEGTLMCHQSYVFRGNNEETQYDWYFTKDRREFYRVITYADGTIEKTRLEGSEELEKTEYSTGDINLSEAFKEPRRMVLSLNDLPDGYSLIREQTGETKADDHIYPSERLAEVGWEGGYRIAFDNEKVYLFKLNIDYKKYLAPGVVSEELKKVFKDNNEYLSNREKLYKIDDASWKIQADNTGVIGSTEYYLIEETGNYLKVYKKSFMYHVTNYRFIFNTASVYGKDKMVEVFGDAKQVMINSYDFVSSPAVGDDCALYKKEFSEGEFNYTEYALIFRKLNVLEEIHVMGESLFIDENEPVKLAKIVGGKIG